MTYVKLKNREIYTSREIDKIDNHLTNVGYIMVVNKEDDKKIIITRKNIVFADEC